jgi:hypothetical protein
VDEKGKKRPFAKERERERERNLQREENKKVRRVDN